MVHLAEMALVVDFVDSADDVVGVAGGTGPAAGGDTVVGVDDALALAADGALAVAVECAVGLAAGETAVDVAGVALVSAVAATGEMIADVGPQQYWHVQEKMQMALTVDQVVVDQVSSPTLNQQNSDGHDS